ncbi:MAG: ribosome biogenesis GTPase YlqF [Clostridia bacterium]|nr:ribosome biogenesis GTPase YlqF [Clostridia bacterium]
MIGSVFGSGKGCAVSSTVIQWFPGHMAKTRRRMAELLPEVDIVLEILDARIPLSSRNPDIRAILGDKPSLILLNKSSLADPSVTAEWTAWFAGHEKTPCLAIDCKTGEHIDRIVPAIREALAEKLERYRQKGMEGRRLKAMAAGIPNVGKSSLINRLCGAKKAKVEDRPGVTMDKQWVSAGGGLDLLDMPGVLWPKFDDRVTGENLALTGAIRDRILDVEELAVILTDRLRRTYPDLLLARYRLDEAALDAEAPALFEMIGRKRGFVVRGGEVDDLRTATMLLDEFRAAVPGRMSLERPPEGGKE